MSMSVTIAVEGMTDAAVARRLLSESGYQPGLQYIKEGKTALDQSLRGFNNAPRLSCWLVLRDLDRDAACAPDLLRTLLPSPPAHMRLHIPVRAIETWLLADAESFSAFFSVARSRIPPEPESVPNPKEAVVSLARHSRSRAMRDALVPRSGTTAKVGPGYSAVVTQFVSDKWRA